MNDNVPVTVNELELRVDQARMYGCWFNLANPPAPETPTLVFLHEALGSVSLWRDFPIRVATTLSLNAFSFDRFGHGRSDPLRKNRSSKYLHEEAFEVLPEVLRQAGIAKSIFIGHSDGGSIALLFASRFPEQTTAVITEAAHIYPELETADGIYKTIDLYQTSALRSRLMRHHGAKTDALFAAWADTWLAPEMRTWNIEAYLPLIRCPVLVTQGADDEYATPRHAADIARQVVGPATTLIIPNCGHIPHYKAAGPLLSAIASFVSSLPL